ncbi:hypothetical protein AXE80_13925 [Wenyingzhuangia fucanilytica]|uniref:TonB C-terminal domain-containing protein n=1 Tax=Wenyingzhuangia fucanilytica TaxID=1790137 RepID=A0A1B1Y998_9FLAO|nr:hypothetical protein [Wenyingzhuangia fucanilytica]ANW97324.1 hypothetical protein AXE80_13925 [Wenyingzhuangia fucanilytica]
MNKLIAIILALTLFSCEKICSVTSALCKGESKKIEAIDFTQIDQFPQFKNCDALLNFEESKTCFEQSIHQEISSRVQHLKFISKENISDTLQINFTIDKNGVFLCNKIIAKDSLKIKIPNLSIEIQKIIQSLPAIHPAQKRGIPVTSTYTIPLVINTKQ